MNSWIARRYAVPALALALAALLFGGCDDASPTTPAPPPAPAPATPPAEDPAPPQIPAEEVVDRETLRQFVEAAIHAASEGVASGDEAYAFFDTTFRPEGQWRKGEIYLFILETNGTMFFHPLLPELEGQDLSDLEDVQGVRFTQKVLEAAAAGGGYVEYLWSNPAVEGDEVTGSPKVSYASIAVVGDLELVIGSGIYPPVTAADVRNIGTLKSFVDRAAAELAANASDPDMAYAFLDATFRPEGEWRQGEIYLFALDLDGVSVFHAESPELEGRDLSDLEDSQGVRMVEEFLKAAAAGGGYVEYLWPNPAIAGDTESPKVSYAVYATVGDAKLVVGSGIYP